MAQGDDPKPDPLMEALSNEREPAIEPPPSFIDIGRYILNENHEAVACPDLMKWASWIEAGTKRVRLTRVGPYFVSTVFLGLDHSFGRYSGQPHTPILFETMAWIEREHTSPAIPEFGLAEYVHKRDWEDI